MMMNTKQTAWYALRRTLVPWRFDELLQELTEKAAEYRIDEVIIKIDTEEFSHGHPPLEMIHDLLPRLKQAKKVLTERGIRFSLNPWSTLGHADRGHRAEDVLPNIGTMVGHDGIETTHCACPLSNVWKNYMVEMWKLYAELEPDVMWIEDDIRNFNHAPVQYGCFCDAHLDRFADVVGERVDRETLVGHLLAKGEPHPYREAFLRMQGEITNEVVAQISKALAEVSPHTIIGLMSSGPFNHVLEGRNWQELEAAMGGKHAISRPPLGNYSENSLRGLYYSQHSIKLTRRAFHNDIGEMTEVEGIPFTQYAKSNTFTFLQMAVSFALGCEGVTLNVFDHRGSFMEEDPEVGKMLAEGKDFLTAMKLAASEPGSYRGAGLLFHPDYSFKKQLASGSDYADLAVQDEVASDLLEPLGIPTTYGDSPVTVVTGQMLRGYSDEEVLKLLEKGLLIDSVAAAVLIERGFGKQIGLASVSAPQGLDTIAPVAAEAYFNEDFGGDANCFLSPFLPEYGQTPRISQLELLPSATVVSHLVDADRNPKETVLTIAENELGGRVAVYAYELAHAVGTSFFHFYRRRQLVNLMQWLAKDPFPALVHNAVYPLLICKDKQDATFCALFNLTLDPYEQAEIELNDERGIAAIRWLGQDGQWTDAGSRLETRRAGSRHFIAVNAAVDYRCPVCLEIEWMPRRKTIR